MTRTLHDTEIFYIFSKRFGDQKNLYTQFSRGYGRAIAQAVSRWLPTAAARFQSRVWSRGICGGQSGAGAGFLRVLRFPLPFIQPKFSILTITRGRYNRPRLKWPTCPVDRVWTPSPTMQI
jgi:hypothetical protein